MKFAIDVPNFGAFANISVLVQFARDAEAAGWDGFFIWDHLVRATQYDVVDPWIALAAIAANTQRIKLGTLVTPLARRRPWKVARETVSLDHLSNGRFIFGVGLGGGSGQQVEWENFGEEADLVRRAEMLDEGLQIVNGLWSAAPFSFEGNYYTVRDSLFSPAPLQKPRIPVWVASRWPNKAPLRRAAEWDGMCPLIPTDTPLLHMRDAMEYVKRYRTATTPFDVVYLAVPSFERDQQRMDIIASFADLGVTWWVDQLEPPYFGGSWNLHWNLDAMHQHISEGITRIP